MRSWGIGVGSIVLASILLTVAPFVVFHVDPTRYVQALAMAGLAMVGVVAMTPDWVRKSGVLSGSSPARKDSPPMPVAPAAVQVTGAVGICPLGFRPGDLWLIDRQGKVSPSLCSGALAALAPLLDESKGGTERRARCRCATAGSELTFVVVPPSEAAKEP